MSCFAVDGAVDLEVDKDDGWDSDILFTAFTALFTSSSTYCSGLEDCYCWAISLLYVFWNTFCLCKIVWLNSLMNSSSERKLLTLLDIKGTFNN